MKITNLKWNDIEVLPIARNPDDWYIVDIEKWLTNEIAKMWRLELYEVNHFLLDDLAGQKYPWDYSDWYGGA